MAADTIDRHGLFKLVCDPLQNARQARLNHAVIRPATVPFSGEKAVLLQQAQMARHYRPGDIAALGKLPYRRYPLNHGLYQANPNGMSNCEEVLPCLAGCGRPFPLVSGLRA